MSSEIPITDIGVIVLAALAFGAVLTKLGQSSSIGYILAGVLLGPLGLKILTPDVGLAPVFGELGILMLLFYLGLEMNVKKLRETGAVGLVLAIAEMATAFTGGFLIAKLFGYSDFVSAVAASILPMTSTVIVVKFIMDKGLLQKLESRVSISTLMFEDLFAILILVMLTSLSTQKSFNTIVLNGLAFTIAVFFIMSKVSKPVLNFLNSLGHSDKIGLYAIAVGIVVAYLGAWFDLSPTLGAYFAGFALAESAYGEKIKNELGFFREFFVLFFFAYFGVTLFFDSTTSKIVLPTAAEVVKLGFFSLSLLVVYLVARIISYGVVGNALGFSQESAMTIASLMIPLGEFSIIIISGTKALLTVSEFNFMLSTAFVLIMLTTMLAPWMFANAPRIGQFFYSLYPEELRKRLQILGSGVNSLGDLSKNPAFQSEFARIIETLLFNLFLALAIVYFSLLIDSSYPHSFIPMIPNKVSLGFAVLPFIMWPVFKVMTELKLLVKKIVDAVIAKALSGVKGIPSGVEHQIEDVFTGLILVLVGVASTVFGVYHLSFNEPAFLLILLPLSYTLLAIMYLSNSFYGMLEHYEGIEEVLGEELIRFAGGEDVLKMSQDFDTHSEKLRSLHLERALARERIRDALRNNDLMQARVVLSDFKKRETRVMTELLELGAKEEFLLKTKGPKVVTTAEFSSDYNRYLQDYAKLRAEEAKKRVQSVGEIHSLLQQAMTNSSGNASNAPSVKYRKRK